MRSAVLTLLAFTLLAITAETVRAQDASALEDAALTVDATAPGCGSLSFQGECQGDIVRYCSAGQIRSMDCSDPAAYPRGGPQATCGLLDCLTSGCQGYWCVAKPGTSCADLGCDVMQDLGCLDGQCRASSRCNPTSDLPSCDGSILTYCAYTVGNLDCSEGGTRPYTCDVADPDRDPCVGEAGASCNPTLGRVCAEPLSCVAGMCVTGEPLDAGTGDSTEPDRPDAGAVRDAGQGRGDDGAPVDCQCRAGLTPQPLLALGVLVAAWRRRH